MHNNELGGITLPNSIETNATIRLAHAAGDSKLAETIRRNATPATIVEMVDGHPTARAANVTELPPEITGELMELYFNAISGNLQAAYPGDVSTIAKALNKAKLLRLQSADSEGWIAIGDGVQAIRQALDTYGLRGLAMQRLREGTLSTPSGGEAQEVFCFDDNFAKYFGFYALRLAANGHRPAYNTPPIAAEVSINARKMLEAHELIKPANSGLFAKFVALIHRSSESTPAEISVPTAS